MVEPAIANVIGPAVAADDPDAAPHEMIDHRDEIACGFAFDFEQSRLQFAHADSLGAQLEFLNLRRVQNICRERFADHRRQLRQQGAGQRQVLVGRQPEAEAKFGVILEQGIRPRRAAPFVILGPWRHRQAAAIDRRAAGGVGYLRAVAKKLRQEPEVRRFATAGASAGEFKQRLQKLDAAHIGEIYAGAVVDRQFLEKGDVLALAFDQRQFIGKVDRLDFGLARTDRRAGFDAQAAAGAILDIELQGEATSRDSRAH